MYGRDSIWKIDTNYIHKLKAWYKYIGIIPKW